MASLVVVEFDDDDAARKFVEKVNDGFSPRGREYKNRRVVGMFGQPRKFCECPDAQQASSRKNPVRIQRGQKRGWWVHDACARPLKGEVSGAAQSPRNVLYDELPASTKRLHVTFWANSPWHG